MMEQELKPYPEYKEIGLPWLKNIPSHWSVIRNKNVLVEQKAIVGEKSNDFKLLSLTKQGVIYRDLENAKGKFPKEFNTYKIVEKDNLIFCLFDLDETPRTVGISSHSGMITGAYDVFKINNVNSHYVFYYYLSIDNIKGLKPLYSGLRKVVKMPVLLSTKLPIPPRIEQDQIVKYLDYKISKINKFIKSKKREIELLKELKQAEINSAVTKGLNPNVPMKDSGIGWLGEIPEHWAVKRLKSFCDFVNRGSTPIYTDEPLAKVVNQATFSKGFWDLNNIRYTSANVQDNRGLLSNKDILLASTGGGVLGKCYLFKEEGIYIADSHVTIIRDTKNRFIPEYIYYFLLVNYHLINGILAQGSTNQIELQKEWLRSMFFPYPGLKEQLEIITYLIDFENKVNRLIESIEIEIAKIQEYKTSLISDVVTGKVDVRDVKIEDTFEMETLEEVEDEIEEMIEE